MFSQSIQNLIDTSGKQAAIQRITQINNYVNTLTNNDVDPSKNVAQSFNDVLKSSKAEDSRFKVSNDENISLSPTQNLVNPSKPQILQLISKIAQKYDMDENLIKAVVKQESGFKSNAVSKAGAMGLMQLMPRTAKGLGVKDPFNPVQNLEGGVKHLKGLLARYNGNLVLALAAYNAGGGNVDKYNGVPPFAETQNYVKNILANYLG